jgi:hypothetical protein
MMIGKGVEDEAARELAPAKRHIKVSALRRWGVWAIVAGLAVWMVVTWAHVAGTVIRYYSPLPFWDYWETVTRYQLFLEHHWLGALWEQHNEHRIVFPQLIFAADYRFFAGREILPLFLNVIFYLATWGVLSAVLIRSNMPRTMALWASLVAGIVMAWEGAALEIAGAFLVQWTLLLFAGTLGLFALSGAPRSTRPWAKLALAILFAVVVTYSAANGLTFWFVLLGAAWLLRLRWKQIAVLGIAAAVSGALYFAGYRVSHQTDWRALARHPLYAAEFIGAYMGSPFTVAKLWLGVVIGWVAFAAVLGAALIAGRRRILGSSTGVVLTGMYCLCVLTAAMTALGRMDPNDAAFGGATAQRYIIIPLVADACALSIIAWAFGARLLYGVISLLFVAGLWFTSSSVIVRSWCEFVKLLLRSTQVVALAVESGIDDPRVLETVYLNIPLLRQRIEVLRQHNWSVFADPQTHWLGKPVSAVIRSISSTAEPGAITFIRVNKGDLVVKGWSKGKRDIWGRERLLFVNEQDTIVGFGEKTPAALHLISARKMEQREWMGFVNRRYSTRTFTAYVLRDGGTKLVRVGNPASIPPIRDASVDEAGPPLGSVTWRMTGSWQKNGSFPFRPRGIPSTGEYYESWSGSDANVGTMQSEPFATPDGRCVVVGTANGPSVNNLSVLVLDADTSSKIASMPLDGDDQTWHFWKVDIPAGVKRLQMVAEDNGRGWGQWLSVGEVRSCK